jgi:uncharacterized protein
MLKHYLIIGICIVSVLGTFAIETDAVAPGHLQTGALMLEYRNVTVYAPAVAQTNQGYEGVISTVTLTIQNNGSGRVFVDTLPLAQIDMQGSARLAVKVASALVKKDSGCQINPSEWDYFFVIRTSAPIIGGPSAGGIMTAAVTSLLEGWSMDNKTVMTGMINPDGSIGPIGGILHKIDAAYSVGATTFLIPKGQMTYQDIITETTVQNGITTIIQKPVVRNVSEYARDQYDMMVHEVEDINEVMLYFTGYEFPIVQSDDVITTQDYIDAMKPLATRLLNEANESYSNASDLFLSASIPNRYPYYYRNQITDFFNDAEDTLKESQEWYTKNVFYTSTSKSFQSLINSNFVIYACEYFSSDNSNEYLSNQLKEVERLYENKSTLAKDAQIKGTTSLQCVGAAQKRASDAASYLADAKTAFSSGEDLTALYDLAFATQRSDSIEWWLGLTAYFNDTSMIESQELDDLASDYIEDAQQAIVYSNVILQEMGRTSAYLSDAEEMLTDARQQKTDGYPAAAVFEALEALSKANLALELIDGVSEDKIARANESASASITESRLMGIEPLLAVSYYEYAESLLQESVQNAMFYYKYSDLIPGVLTFTGSCGSQSSRFIGIPDSSYSIWEQGVFKYKEYFILFAAIGALGGLGLGLMLGGIYSKKKEDKHPLRPSSNTVTTQKTSEQDYFPHGQLPRSIQDYYQRQDKK